MKFFVTKSKRQLVTLSTLALTGVLVAASIGTYLLTPSKAAGTTDLNNDSKTDVFDLSILLSKWGQSSAGASDINGDGTVNIFDLSMLLSGWGQSTGGFQANCIVKPSVCGYPDETNTGVPAGVTLTNSGSITVTQNGAIIQNLNINGQIVIRANNVTIRNVKLTSGDYYPIDHNNGNTGLLIEDSEIIGTNSNVTASVSFDNYTLRRVNVHGGADGLKGNSNVVVEDSYIHSLSVGQDTHNDGFQATGGSGITLRHNTFKLSTTPGTSACIQMGNEWGPNNNWLVTNNLIDGGGWSINASASGTNRVFTNNRFTRNAGYGPGSVPGSTWTGNYYDDNGAVVNG